MFLDEVKAKMQALEKFVDRRIKSSCLGEQTDGSTLRNSILMCTDQGEESISVALVPGLTGDQA